MDKSLTSDSESMSKRLERGLTLSQAAYMKRNILEEEIKGMKSKYSGRKLTPGSPPTLPPSPKPAPPLSSAPAQVHSLAPIAELTLHEGRCESERNGRPLRGAKQRGTKAQCRKGKRTGDTAERRESFAGRFEPSIRFDSDGHLFYRRRWGQYSFQLRWLVSYSSSFWNSTNTNIRILDGLSHIVSEQGPMENDEFVIRFFGMKNCDGMLKVATNLTTGTNRTKEIPLTYIFFSASESWTVLSQTEKTKEEDKGHKC